MRLITDRRTICALKNFYPILLISMIVLISYSHSFAQTSYLVTHYSRQVYGAGSQNWSIDQDKQGFVYAANNNGLLV